MLAGFELNDHAKYMPRIYVVNPSGELNEYKCFAIGKNSSNLITIL